MGLRFSRGKCLLWFNIWILEVVRSGTVSDFSLDRLIRFEVRMNMGLTNKTNSSSDIYSQS